MTIRKLEKPEWRPFLDIVSKLLEAKEAEIEVASLDLGDQVVAEWLPLLGISYDPKDDIVEVALDGVDHLIRGPREIYLENGAGALTSIEIVDANDAKQIVKLKDKLMLPAPNKWVIACRVAAASGLDRADVLGRSERLMACHRTGIRSTFG
jgi:hypothetical protein